MLKPKQRKCIELMLEGEKKQKEIAAALNISEKTISEWKKNEEFIAAYDEALKAVLRYASGKALRKQIKLIDSRSDNVAHLAAKDILDRGGYKAAEEIKLEDDSKLNITISGGGAFDEC